MPGARAVAEVEAPLLAPVEFKTHEMSVEYTGMGAPRTTRVRALAPRRAVLYLVLAAVGVAGTAMGMPRVLASFASSSSNDANTFSAAASFPASPFIREVGTSSCGAGSSSITVPPGGIPAGHTVVVRFVARGTTSGPVSASDNRGNVYTTDVDVFNAGVRTVVLSSRLSTGLLANEHFTVSYPAASASSVALEEFANIAPGVRVDSTGTGTGQSRSPSATVTSTNGPDLLFALSGNQNVRSYAEASGWTPLPEATTACGGATGDLTNHAAYRIVSATGSYTYAPTISLAEKWAVGLVAYKRG